MSTLDDTAVRTVPGAGVVVRAPGVVGVVLPASEAHRALVATIVEALRSAAGADDAGRRAARAVAGVLADADDPPPLGVVGADGDGVAVLLAGGVEFTYQGADGSDQVLSGQDSATWLDRLLDHVPAEWSLAREGAGAADELSELTAGVVRADGLAAGPPSAPGAASTPAPTEADEPTELQDVASPDAAAESAPPPPSSPSTPPGPAPGDDFLVIALDDPPEDEGTREPLPVVTAEAPAPTGTDADEPDAPLVGGVKCSRGHFNDPNSPFCAVCGISMVQQTHNLVEGPRPPLGVLVLDDGTTYVVDRDIVIGREPEGGDNTRTITLADPSRKVSRTHARVVLDGWEARVLDAGSANGTFVAARDATQWTPVAPDSPVPLTAGMHVLVGQRVLSFDSHRRT